MPHYKVSCLLSHRSRFGRIPMALREYDFGDWAIHTSCGHILESVGEIREKYENELSLPHLPEMVYGKNALRLTHQRGFGLSFSALDALKTVDAEHDIMSVAVSEEWKSARSNCEFINRVIKPFDWTYSTDYKGTTFSNNSDEQLNVEETDKRLNIEKLKERERILFFAEVDLFEDELSDNGCSKLVAKIRVMPSGYFVLLRQYMRVDDILVRITDTRCHYELPNNYILREFSVREKATSDLLVPNSVLLDPNEVYEHLELKTQHTELLRFPELLAITASE